MLLLPLAVGLGGCSYADRADLRSGERPPFELVSSHPAPADRNVARAAPIDLIFNAAPDSGSVADIDVRVYSGVAEAAGTIRIDLLERRLRMQPFRTLRPELRYQVYLAGTVRGLNGSKLANSVTFDFTTGTEEGSPAPPPPVVSGTELQPLFSTHCVRCHSGPEPPMSVDLTSPEAVRRSLRTVPSSSGVMMRAAPGDHARSYLMRKLLGAGHLGAPMPPDGPPLSPDDMRRVADWIDAGAL